MDVLKYHLKKVLKLPISIWDESREASKHIARSIALAIQQKQQNNESIVLGLATGSSPIKVYDELVRMHKEEGLSFKNVITFNLDEYFPMKPDSPQSYVCFMNEYLFNHIDIPKENINIPDGTIEMDQWKEYCDEYEASIKAAGGLDIQLLGIGRTGHVGFNEPGSWEDSKTRLVRLDALTRKDAEKDFISVKNVPYRAITMGIGTIMKARTVYLVGWGQHKAAIVKEAFEGPITDAIPASFLQEHPDVKVFLDKGASEELTRVKSPWKVGICNWTNDLICSAVVWLSDKVNKPILKLTDEDYNENKLSDLIVEYESAYIVNIQVFNRLQRSITGWPGGKPNSDDKNRPERAKPEKKRVIVFSPHPDDDVISMGGTLLRLVEQGHDVHVAYQTSGNNAVHNHDAKKYIEFVEEFCIRNDIKDENLAKAIKLLYQSKPSKKSAGSLLSVKALIRRGEARAGARFCEIPEENIHFLDLPFYETGTSRKKPLGEEDIQIVSDFIKSIKPHQIYAAGDLADPHGTHRICLDSITTAYSGLKNESWIKDCWLWLYRGAWHEWAIHEIEMAVPLSPEQLLKKRKAIFMHQSQKDGAPFLGDDEREFWQRAEDRNRATANTYKSLGLAEYEAMEAFVRYRIF